MLGSRGNCTYFVQIHPACAWPDQAVLWGDGLLKELELVEVEDNDVSSTENGHQDTHAAEDECVEGPAKGPPGAEEQKDEEVHSRGQWRQHDTCEHKHSGGLFSWWTQVRAVRIKQTPPSGL